MSGIVGCTGLENDGLSPLVLLFTIGSEQVGILEVCMHDIQSVLVENCEKDVNLNCESVKHI